MGDIEINALLYADDLVIFTDSIRKMQSMIDRLEDYCCRWNLILNRDKSKIMVFRRGGRLSRSENWRYGKEPIDVVNEYKYLGVTFTSTLSLTSHIKNKVSIAKYGVNSVWRRLITNNDVPVSTKRQVFSSVSKAIVTYAAEVWGYQQKEELEKLHRFFIKRLLCLPVNTPNYILYLESGENKIWLDTLKINYKYIVKAINLPDSRFVRKITILTSQSRCGWAKEWRILCRQYNVDWVDPVTQPNEWIGRCNIIIDRIRDKLSENWWNNAANSQFHSIYHSLRMCNPVKPE